MDRFHVPPPLDADTVTLSGGEAHHLIHVLRARPGEQVALFDGTGVEATAEISAVGRREVQLRIVERRVIPLPAIRTTTIAAAAPKGDRLRFLVEKLTELGAARLILLDTERSVVDPRESRIEKLHQTVIAACKQSGRSCLMRIVPPTPLDEFISGGFADALAVIAQPGGEPLARLLADAPADRPLIGLIGPEGGFTDAEVSRAVAAGAIRTSLGETILRTETAAMALAACAILGR